MNFNNSFANCFKSCFYASLLLGFRLRGNDDRRGGGRTQLQAAYPCLPKNLTHLCVILLSLLLTSPTHATTPREAITQVKKKREALTLEQKRLIQEAKTIEEMIEQLSRESEDNQQRLVHHEHDISKTLPLLARLERSSPLRLIVDSSTGQYRVRGMILVRTLIASLKRKMRDVQAALNDLKIRTQDLGAQHETTQHLLHAIEEEKAQLLVVEKEKLKDWTKSERERLEGNLDDNTLLEESRATLSKERREASLATASQGLPFRRLQPPVRGKIMKDAELQQKFSPHSQGVFFEAQKNEQVCAPAKGQIVFRGPFRTQGEILIIDHGEKVHTILMGMHKINANVGKNVYAGEKLGTMAGYGAGPLKLYLELRHQGKAIDSTPYFARK